MTRPPLKILLPFSDDSTLFFVQRMSEALAGTGCQVQTAWLTNGSDLTYRQLVSILPNGPEILLHTDAFKQVLPLQSFDAIVTSRMFPALRDMLRKLHVRHMADRPCVIAFQGGLEFDPERGFFNRRHADAVFIVPQDDIAAYRCHMRHEDTGAQYLGFGHPTFVSPGPAVDRAALRDIYFFAQAISPVTRRARLHILKMLDAIARANPDRTVWLKLRHLAHENSEHLHREIHSYDDLIRTSGLPVPDNLRVTAEGMDTVLKTAGIGITCTSTAAVDLIRAGVPTLIYLDYVENYLDPLVAPMRRLFADSNLVAGLDDVLNLRARAPDRAWLQKLFCPQDRLAAQLLGAVEHFRQRPVAVNTLLPALEAGVPPDRSGSSD